MHAIQATGSDEPCILAIDVGSSSVRALLYDCRGRQVAGSETQLPYRQHVTPDGGSESSPAELLDLVERCVSGERLRGGQFADCGGRQHQLLARDDGARQAGAPLHPCLHVVGQAVRPGCRNALRRDRPGGDAPGDWLPRALQLLAGEAALAGASAPRPVRGHQDLGLSH